MYKRRYYFLILIFLFPLIQLSAQTLNPSGELGNEQVFNAMNKQVNEFVRRFNMEEAPNGTPLAKTDRRYHNRALRRKILPYLFNRSNPRTNGELQKYFIEDVTNKKHPVYLNFKDKNWYAEVSATFKNDDNGTVNLILFLTVQQDSLGYKWIISNVYDADLHQLFPTENKKDQMKYFLHPQSHEIDFMDLHKAFDDPKHIEYYAATNYRPDYLTLFFYLMKTGVLKFETINSVKFHFFQIHNWYFELEYFNRNTDNSGWLISNLKYISDKDKAQVLRYFNSCSTKK